jgi:hypothetical protein
MGMAWARLEEEMGVGGEALDRKRDIIILWHLLEVLYDREEQDGRATTFLFTA